MRLSRCLSTFVSAVIAVASGAQAAQVTHDPDDARLEAQRMAKARDAAVQLVRLLEAGERQQALRAFEAVETAMRDLRPTGVESRKSALEAIERSIAESAPARVRFIGVAAQMAFGAEEYRKARALAEEALSTGRQKPEHSAQNLYFGNHVLGLLALRERDVQSARHHLLASALHAGWPAIRTSGPNLTLAKRLLEAGEAGGVLQFLESCKLWWPEGRQRLDQWQAIIRAGAHPEWREQHYGPLP